jgi:hypothetical protein
MSDNVKASYGSGAALVSNGSDSRTRRHLPCLDLNCRMLWNSELFLIDAVDHRVGQLAHEAVEENLTVFECDNSMRILTG